jgi:hypothetical protein
LITPRAFPLALLTNPTTDVEKLNIFVDGAKAKTRVRAASMGFPIPKPLRCPHSCSQPLYIFPWP